MRDMFHDIEVHDRVPWMQRLKVRGVVIWPKVMFAEDFHAVPEYIIRHELEHVYQIRREGPWRFYLKFFWNSLRYGYYYNPYERAARAVQHHPLTDDERTLLCRLNDASMQQQRESPRKLKPVIRGSSSNA